MDSIKNAIGMGSDTQTQHNNQAQSSNQTQSGGFFGGISEKLNTAAGGGRESEKNEDLLDKGILIPSFSKYHHNG